MLHRLRACLLGTVLLAVPPATGVFLPALLLPLGFSSEAEARPRASGGYSRPSSSSRAPSSSSGYARPRTPSSGGYGLPTSGSRPSVTYGGSSAGDQSYSRAQSSDALQRMRARQTQDAERARQPAPQAGPQGSPAGGGYGGGYTGGGYSGGGYGGGSSGSGYANSYGGIRNGGWYRDRGWPMPGGMLRGPSSFGIWDAAFLWLMFNSLSQPGHADFFRNHQDDPGYREWRREAEQRARDDADTRAKLEDLDRRLDANADQPRDPNYLPPGVPAEIATGQPVPGSADRTPSSGAPDESGGGVSASVLLVLLGGAGGLGFLAWRRSRGGNQKGTGMANTPVGSAAAMLRHKASGEGYAPSRFRVGMTLTLDPTPFLLAAGATHLAVPDAAQPVSVTEVGRIGGDAPGALVRLYLPEASAMLQLHLGQDNVPDECRYFAPLDQITPADEAEWGAWLDPQEGMIGWPEFQTKDGRTYARIWSPGDTRVEPRELVEEVEGTAGRRTVRSQTMLYGADTGLPAPAPETEYIMVSAIEDAGQAWVEVRAGIDINPASLSLA